MQAFTDNQILVLALVFVLGVLIGMFLFAGSKWKRRYREEVARREALERDNAQLRRDHAELESLRGAAARNPGPQGRGPL